MEEPISQNTEEKNPKWAIELALEIKRELKKQIEEGRF